jgi:predicted MPP superfamily phosphohydrolase
MIRIVHLSDIHLDANTLKDAKQFIFKALNEDIKKFNNEKKIDLIIFSGDLIDKGGQSFNNDIDLAFLTFEEDVVKSMAKELSIDNGKCFFAPGNHDISRSLIDPIYEAGIKQLLDSTERVNEFIDSQKTDGIKRILNFKEIERNFHKDLQEGTYKITNYQSCFKIKVKDYNIGITCFNTAWRSYNTDTDKGSLILGERQITDVRSIIDDCHLKLAVIHHPIDWLINFDQASIKPLMFNDYDLFFCGHVHQGSGFSQSNMYGNIFINVAPANWAYDIRNQSRLNANGYSILDYCFTERKIITHSRRYAHLKGCFDPNTDLGDDKGVCEFSIPSTAIITKQQYEIQIARKVMDLHFNELNTHLLTYNTDTKAPKEIETLFVHPRIVSKIQCNADEAEKEEIHSIESLSKGNDNIIIYGIKESGKTVLLDMILINLTKNVQKYHKAVIYLDFNEIGHKRFENIISTFLGISIKEVNHLTPIFTASIIVTKIIVRRSR